MMSIVPATSRTWTFLLFHVPLNVNVGAGVLIDWTFFFSSRKYRSLATSVFLSEISQVPPLPFSRLPCFYACMCFLVLSINSQEGALAEKYRALHAQKNPDSKTFIVGETSMLLLNLDISAVRKARHRLPVPIVVVFCLRSDCWRERRNESSQDRLVLPSALLS